MVEFIFTTQPRRTVVFYCVNARPGGKWKALFAHEKMSQLFFPISDEG